jgi:hypothetical protein
LQDVLEGCLATSASCDAQTDSARSNASSPLI